MSSSAVARRVGAVWTQAVAALAAAVMYAAAAVAGVLVLHILLVWLAANPANAIVSLVSRMSGWLVGPFRALFTPSDPKQQIAINEGLAAVVYLLAGGLIARGVRMLGGRLIR
jgi:hypothetical protein